MRQPLSKIAGTTVLCLAALGLSASSTTAQNQNDQYSPDQDYQQQSNQDFQGQDENRDYQSQSDRQNQSRDYESENEYDRSRNQQSQFDQTRQSRDEQRAGLGVVLQSDRGNVEVRNVARNSPADNAGIRPGDEILAVNGRNIDSAQQLVQLIQNQEPGAQVSIRVRRNGQTRTLHAQLESRREALNLSQREWQDRQRQERYYRSSPPWESDDVMRHVNNLERQVDRLQQEIDDLRAMLQSNPSGSSYSSSQRNQYDNQDYREARQPRNNPNRSSDNRMQNNNQDQYDNQDDRQSRD